MQYWHTFSFHPHVYVHLSHNRLYLYEILYTIDIWTAVCVFEHWETDRALSEKLKKWSVHERELFYQRDSAYTAFTNAEFTLRDFQSHRFHRCFHTARLSEVAVSRCCVHIARWIGDRRLHTAWLYNKKSRQQLCLVRKLQPNALEKW